MTTKPLDAPAPAAGDYRRYLQALADLNTARVALLLAQEQLGKRRAALEEAVEALGNDPLYGLQRTERGRKPPARPAAYRSLEEALGEILPLLPGRTADLSRRHGGLSAKYISNRLRRAEQLGMVRREETGERTSGGRLIAVWHRVPTNGSGPG